MKMKIKFKFKIILFLPIKFNNLTQNKKFLNKKISKNLLPALLPKNQKIDKQNKMIKNKNKTKKNIKLLLF